MKITWFVVLFTFLLSLGVSAQGLDLEDDLGTIEYGAMDISGQLAPRKKRLSASDRLKLYRRKLEQKNRVQMEKKMERMRIKSEIRLMKKMQDAFNRQMNQLDEV